MLDICIIGACGHTNYVTDLLPTDIFRIVGISIGSQEDLDNIGNIHNKIKIYDSNIVYYDDYKRMINELNPDICVNNTVFYKQSEVNSYCLENDISVFSEKPVATTIDQLDKLISVLKKSKGFISGMFGTKGSETFQTAKLLIEEGKIGDIRLIHAQKSYRLLQRAPFFMEREKYGGTIPWVGIHAIDWMNWLSSLSYKSVIAYHTNKDNRDHGDLEVAAACLFELQNEVFATINIDYLRPDSAIRHDDDSTRIVGTKGIISIRDGKLLLLDNELTSEKSIELVKSKNIFIDMLESLENKEAMKSLTKEAVNMTYVGLMTNISADKKTRIDLVEDYYEEC